MSLVNPLGMVLKSIPSLLVLFDGFRLELFVFDIVIVLLETGTHYTGF